MISASAKPPGARVANDTYITPNLIGEATVYEFCQRGWLEPQLETLRALYGPRLIATGDALREFLPDAQITFDNETGGRERSGNFMIDNSRVVQEFGMQFRPYRERILQIINEVRAEEGKPLVSDR